MTHSDALWLATATITVAAAAAVTLLACRWWYGRKLAAAAQRLKKSDQGRLFSQQQAQDARRQIEALKRELATERVLGTKQDDTSRRARELEERLRVAERAAAEYEASKPMPLQPAHGFADTQILG